MLGSSLTVFSGFRFVRAAHRLGIPVAIVNQGPTRADDLADVRLDAPIASTLADLLTPTVCTSVARTTQMHDRRA